MWMILIAVLVFLLVFHSLEDIYMIYMKGLPPGPLSLPLIGGLYRLSPTQPQLGVNKLVEEYGSIFSLRMGPSGRAVLLQDMDMINQVFESADTNDRPTMPFFDILNGKANGIGSCPYNPHWKEMTHTFQRGLTKLSQTSVEDQSDHAFNQLFERLDVQVGNESYNPRPDVLQAIVAIFNSLLFGMQPEFLLERKDIQTFKPDDILTIMSHLHPAHPVNLIPGYWKIATKSRQAVNDVLKVRDETLNMSLQRHKEMFTGDINDIMDIIAGHQLNCNDKHTGAQGVTKDDMLLSVWTIYLAGCNTLVDSMLWLILYLGINTDIQEKMRQEIKLAMADNHQVLDVKHKLHYTRAALLESTRLSTPLGLGLPRTSEYDIQLGEFTVPKGTLIMANQWYIHHNEKYWPDPFEMKPERFLDDNGNLHSNKHIYKTMPFIPFSTHSKRPCIGQYLSLDIYLIFTVGLLNKFSFRLPDGYKPDLGGEMVLTLQPKKFPIVLQHA